MERTRAIAHLRSRRQQVQCNMNSIKNRNKSVMCRVCRKVMRDDHMKRHTSSKLQCQATPAVNAGETYHDQSLENGTKKSCD